MSSSAAEYVRLLRLVVRAFYGGPCPPKGYEDEPENTRSKLYKIDTTGLGVVVVDFLSRKAWVSEQMIVDSLKINHKLMRRALKYLERERLLMSEHRRESRRKRKGLVAAAVAAAGSRGGWDLAALQLLSAQEDEEDEAEAAAAAAEGLEVVEKGTTASYYAVNFPGFFDALQLRLHLMRKALNDQLDNKTGQTEYVCPTAHCRKRFTSLDAHHLYDPETRTLRCDYCDSEIHQMTATGEVADEAARKSNQEETKALLEQLDYELRDIEPLVRVLRAPEHLAAIPNFGTLGEWATEETNRARKEQEESARTGGGGGRGGGHGGGGGGTDVHALNAAYYASETHLQVVVDGGGAASGGGKPKAPPSLMPDWLKKSSVTGEATNGTASTPQVGPSTAAPLDASQQDEEERKRAFQEAYMAQLAAMMAAQQQAQQAQHAQHAQQLNGGMVVAAGTSQTEVAGGASGANGEFEWEDAVAPGAAAPAEDVEWEDI